MIRPLMIVSLIILSLSTVSVVSAQPNIRPAQLQQMMSILTYIENRIQEDGKGFTPEIRLNTILESLEILGVDTGDRNRFDPDMSNSKLSVLLLGGQIPEQQSESIKNAIEILDLAQESKKAAPKAPAYSYSAMESRRLAIQATQYSGSSKAEHKVEYRVPTPAKTKSIATSSNNNKTNDKLSFDLDNIIFNAVSKAAKK